VHRGRYLEGILHPHDPYRRSGRGILSTGNPRSWTRMAEQPCGSYTDPRRPSNEKCFVSSSSIRATAARLDAKALDATPEYGGLRRRLASSSARCSCIGRMSKSLEKPRRWALESVRPRAMRGRSICRADLRRASRNHDFRMHKEDVATKRRMSLLGSRMGVADAPAEVE